MQQPQYQTDDRALTPVIGIILLVSITVLLAATTAAFVLGLEEDTVQQSAPTVAVDFDYEGSGASDTLQVMHKTGGLLDPDQTYVVVDEATCTGGDDPDGRYQARDDFGMSQSIAAGMGLTVEETLAGGTSLCSNDLDLSGATAHLVWRSPDGRTSTLISTWTGPGA